MINRSTVHQNIAIFRVYVSKVNMPKYMRQNVIGLPGKKIHFYNWELNTSPTKIDRTIRQKINKDILEVRSTINLCDLIDIYRLLYPRVVEHTFFSG